MRRNFFRLFRRFTDESSDAIDEFGAMVSMNPVDVQQCFSFYQQNFSNLDPNQRFPIKLENAMLTLLNSFIPYTVTRLEEKAQITDELKFISTTLKFGEYDKKFSNLISQFCVQLLKVNFHDENCLDFMQTALKNDSVLTTFVSPIYLSDIFIYCFDVKDNYYSDLILDTIQSFQFKVTSKENLEAFIDAFRRGSVLNVYSALKFIFCVTRSFHPNYFINEFFPIISNKIYDLESLDFFEYYLQTNNKATWDFLCRSCSPSKLNENFLNSMISLLNQFKENPLILNFPIGDFITNGINLTFSTQEELLEIILKFTDKKRLQFLKQCITSQFHSKIIYEISKSLNDYDTIAQFCIFDIPINELKQKLETDKDYCNLLYYISTNLKSEKVINLIPILLKLSDLNICKKSLKKILKQINPEKYIKIIKKSFKQSIITTDVFQILTKISKENEKFVSLILTSSKTIKYLFSSFQNINDLTFLITIIQNGPYEIIDEYINEHFNETILTKLNEKQLYNLMMGLPFDSESIGILRIPSLLKHVKINELLTPFDRYVYGKYGMKYIENDNGIDEYLIQYIDENKKFVDIVNNTKLMLKMTDLNQSFLPIYQCHFNMPNSFASFEGNVSISFWFYINHLIGKTLILQTSFGEISYDCDGLTIFDLITIQCNMKTWNMLTLIMANQNVKCYLNSKSAIEFSIPKLNYSMQFGSKTFNNSIWYLNSEVISTNEMFTPDEIRNLYLKGLPNVRNDKYKIAKINPKNGFKFVDYNGIGNYLYDEEFIFLLLIGCQTKEEFNDLFESCFNLYLKSLIKTEYFYSSIRYIMIRKKDFVTTDLILKLFINNFNCNDYINVFSDYQIITSINFNYSFFLKLFKLNNNSLTFLMDVLIDCYIFFDINNDLKQIILDITKLMIKNHPSILEKLILYLSNFEDNNLFEIILKNLKLLDFDRLLSFSAVLTEKYSIAFIKKLTKNSIRLNNYNYKSLKLNKSIFIKLIHEIDIWCCLLSFLTNSYEMNLDNFITQTSKNNKILKLILDVLATFIGIEIKEKAKEMLSFKILEIIFSITSSDKILLCTKQILRLSVLGLDNYPYQVIPFNDNDKIEQQIKSQKEEYKFNLSLLQSLQLKNFDFINEFKENNDVKEDDNNEELDIPDEIFESKSISLITNFNVKIFVSELVESLFIKKLFYVFTIFGANVPFKVSLKMHKKIILAFFDLKPNLTEDVMNSLFEFLILRINEGWWESKKRIKGIAAKVSEFDDDNKIKSVKVIHIYNSDKN